MFALGNLTRIGSKTVATKTNDCILFKNGYMKNNTLNTRFNSFFGRKLTLLVGLMMVALVGFGQSNHTVTFSGSSSDFNAAEKYSAQGSGQNVDYYVTFDASYLYIGAFRTNSSTFGSTDNLAVYIDNVPNATPTTGTAGAGTTTGVSYNGVTGALPIYATYAVHVEQSYQEMKTYSSGWGSTNTGINVWTSTTAREVKLAWSSLGSPNSIYLTMFMGYAGGIYGNAPGANVAASANPTIAGYFGGFGVSSAGCIPVNTVNTAITDSYSGTSPVSGTTYGKITLSGAIALNSITNVAPGGSLSIASGATLATQSSTTINMGSGTSITNNNASSTILANLSGVLNFNLSTNYTTGTSVSYVNGTTATTFPASFTTNLYTGVDFGASSNSSITASLNIYAGGYVSTNPPVYLSSSTLAYNTGNTYTVGTEWTPNAPSGAGVPQNVTIGATASSGLSFGTSNSYHQLNGTLLINASTSLTLSTVSGGDLKVGGNFTNSGTFTANSRTVTLNGSATQTIAGSSSFYNLTVSTAIANTLKLTAGTTQTVTGTLTLNGASGNLLTVTSTSSSIATINPTATSVSYCAISYITNSGSAFSAPYSNNLGNNTNITFDNYKWVGSTAGNWETPANWSNGMLPGAYDNVLFDNSVGGNTSPTVTVYTSPTVGAITYSSSNVTYANGSTTQATTATGISNGSAIITLSGSNSNIYVGAIVTLSGGNGALHSGTNTVVAINGNQLTLNQIPATSSTTAGILTFSNGTLTTNNMSVTSSTVTFVGSVTVNTGITLASGGIINYQSAANGNGFNLGNGNGFTLTGCSTSNYFDGNGNAKYVFNYTTGTANTIYFNPTTPSLWSISATKGNLTLGNSVSMASPGFSSTNSSVMTVGNGATLTINGNNSQNYTFAQNGAQIDASGTGATVATG